MRRLLFNIASALSSLLLVATAVLWLRSYWRISTCEIKQSKWISETHLQKMTWEVRLDYGRWRLRHAVVDNTFDLEFVRHWAFVQTDGPNGLSASYRFNDGESAEWHNNGEGLRILGFSLDTRNGPGFGGNSVEDWTSLGVPGWAPVLLLSILPVVWLVHTYRGSDKRKLGHCRACGYNLRGNATGVCPECGAAATAKEDQSLTC